MRPSGSAVAGRRLPSASRSARRACLARRRPRATGGARQRCRTVRSRPPPTGPRRPPAQFRGAGGPTYPLLDRPRGPIWVWAQARRGCRPCSALAPPGRLPLPGRAVLSRPSPSLNVQGHYPLAASGAYAAQPPGSRRLSSESSPGRRADRPIRVQPARRSEPVVARGARTWHESWQSMRRNSAYPCTGRPNGSPARDGTSRGPA